ncbi:MAG: hypothetical protein OES24_05420 [Acidimicrobiia bacterium]|nr:hypothetical protein [Acidimicrobiia bacterium]
MDLLDPVEPFVAIVSTIPLLIGTDLLAMIYWQSSAGNDLLALRTRELWAGNATIDDQPMRTLPVT